MPTSGKRIVVAPAARRDIDEAVAHYEMEGGERLALRFVSAVEQAFDLLSANPAIGSPRYGALLQLPGVRCWPLRPWPQLVFYVERSESVDVFRVLHGSRDVPASLRSLDTG